MFGYILNSTTETCTMQTAEIANVPARGGKKGRGGRGPEYLVPYSPLCAVMKGKEKKGRSFLRPER